MVDKLEEKIDEMKKMMLEKERELQKIRERGKLLCKQGKDINEMVQQQEREFEEKIRKTKDMLFEQEKKKQMATSTGMELMRSLIAVHEAESWDRFDGVLTPKKKAKHVAKIKNIITSRIHVDVSSVTDRWGQTAFHYLAGFRGKLYARLLSILCDHRPECIDGQDSENRTALHKACSFANLSAVRVLVRKGASCCIVNDRLRSPLHMAISALDCSNPTTSYIKSEVVTYLTHHSVMQGLDFEQADCNGESIAYAVKQTPAVAQSVQRGLGLTRRWTNAVTMRLLKKGLVDALVQLIVSQLFGEEVAKKLLSLGAAARGVSTSRSTRRQPQSRKVPKIPTRKLRSISGHLNRMRSARRASVPTDANLFERKQLRPSATARNNKKR